MPKRKGSPNQKKKLVCNKISFKELGDRIAKIKIYQLEDPSDIDIVMYNFDQYCLNKNKEELIKEIDDIFKDKEFIKEIKDFENKTIKIEVPQLDEEYFFEEFTNFFHFGR